jgi:hypothetical protein
MNIKTLSKKLNIQFQICFKGGEFWYKNVRNTYVHLMYVTITNAKKLNI